MFRCRSKSAILKFFFASVGLKFLVACAGPQPIEEMALARAALDAAKDSGAPTVSPGFWHTAEDDFRKANVAMKNNDNYGAKDLFVECRELAEKAENATRLKKFKSGESFP